jgi:hypothetical protein
VLETELLLKQIRLLEEVGRKSAADVAQVESQKAEADYELTRQQNLYASAMLELKKTMAFPMQDTLLLNHGDWSLDSADVSTDQGPVPMIHLNVKMPKDSIKRIGDNCFKRCFSMESIVIPQTVVSVGKAFVDCRSLRTVTIMNSNTIIDKKAFDGCDELSVKCIVPVSKFLSICNCNYHRKPKPISLKRHFRNSKVLAPYFLKIYRTPERVEVIEEMTFLGWTGLECIGISSSVKSIEKRAFAGCINLTQLNFEEGIEAIGRYAFEDCSGLRTLHLPNSLKVIKDFAFAGCSKLVHVSISEYTEVADTAFEKNIKILYRH